MSTSNSGPNIHFCVETKIQGKRWKITKILRGRNSRLGGFFQKAVSTPGKTANRPKYLYLVSRIVVLNPDIEISAGLFISAKYQHSQNRQNRPVNTRKQQNTRAHLKPFQQLSLKMSHRQKFSAYLDDNSLR